MTQQDDLFEWLETMRANARQLEAARERHRVHVPFLVRKCPLFVYEAAYDALRKLGYPPQHHACRWLFAVWFRAGTANEWPDPWWSFRFDNNEPSGFWPGGDHG